MRVQISQGGNAYSIGAATGLLTGVAAASATAGHIFAARWVPSTAAPIPPPLALITRLRLRWVTIAGFTGAQEVGLDLSRLTGYTAAHTGGTALVAAGLGKKRAFGSTGLALPESGFADIRIATTGALTAGTHTFAQQPYRQGAFSELATGAAVPKGGLELSYSQDDLSGQPIVLATGEGICVRNTVAMGAAGTARVVVEMDWLEVYSF